MNVTIPYKNAVIPFLESIDPLAEKIGAVNTLVRDEKGNGFRGYNTDMTGLYRSLEQEGIGLAGEDVILLGAGGVARAVACLCVMKGAKHIYLLNRTMEKAKTVADEINAAEGKECIIPMRLEDYSGLPDVPEKYLCIQCTNVGMYPKEKAVVIDDPSFYQKIHTGVDLVYRPLKTEFLKLAEASGAKTFSGLKMLLYQAVEAFELWNRVQISKTQADQVYEAVHEELQAHTGLVLIGFMGSGKTTVSQILAEKLAYHCLDSDANIEQQQKMKISQIFADKGEAAFRTLETESLRNLAEQKERRMILSAGGGLALKEENRALMRQLGKVIYLKTSPQTVYERVKEDQTRPLLQGDDLMGRIERLEAEREIFYQMAADEVVVTDGRTPEEVADEILRVTHLL
jgi:shikimate dehydrogenase